MVVDGEELAELRNPIITSVRINRKGSQAYVRVWIRGGLAGVLVSPVEDVDELVALLRPGLMRWDGPDAAPTVEEEP